MRRIRDHEFGKAAVFDDPSGRQSLAVVLPPGPTVWTPLAEADRGDHVSGRLSRYVDSKVPLILGGVVVTSGMSMLSLFHRSEVALFALTAVVFVGIGLAFAAIANVVVDHVPQHATGEATGVNALLRALGNALGIQVASGVLGASIVGTATLPTDRSFAIAFLVSAMAAVVSIMTALFIPRASRAEKV